MSEKLKAYIAHLESGFFGFWIRKYRISILLILLIFLLGFSSLISIPKESTPDIDYGIISVTVPYSGVVPDDIETLVTEKVYREIEDIDGIKEITSTSQLGISSTIIQLDTGVEVAGVLQDVKDAVDRISFPSDADDPFIVEIGSDNEVVFSVYLGGKKEIYSPEILAVRAREIQSALEGKNGITQVDITGVDDYEIQVLVSLDELEVRGITLSDIANAVSWQNKNQPLGNFAIGEKNYDFRVQGEFLSPREILDTPLLIGDQTIFLRDIATLERDPENETHQYMGLYENSGYNYVQLTVNKKAGYDIFSASSFAKETIEKLVDSPAFQGMEMRYGLDLSDVILDDYTQLAKNALTTFVLVIISLFIFIEFKASVIAVLAIFMSFLMTFFVLNKIGLSLNFLTNFSLVLTFGIAIDTTIVIIEATYEKLHLGYSRRHAVLLSVREYAKPLISGTATTLVAFLPLMFLPDVMGKYLSYIPITVFSTLVAALFIALTINSALFFIFNRKMNFYTPHPHEDSFSALDAELLKYDREGKKEGHNSVLWRQNILEKINNFYKNRIAPLVKKSSGRILSTVVPIIWLFLSFIFLAPRIGFILFPSGDNPYINIDIEGPVGQVTEKTEEYIPMIEEWLSIFPEIKYYTLDVKNNKISGTIELFKKKEREKLNQRYSGELEKIFNEQFQFLVQQGWHVNFEVQAGGPPTGSPVGIKLITDDPNNLSALIQVSKDFETHIKSFPETFNIENSSESSPGQIIFTLDTEKIFTLGLTPAVVRSTLSSFVNGVFAGQIRGTDDDYSIYILPKKFIDNASPSDLLSMKISKPTGEKVALNSIVSYELIPSILSISREDGDILIQVGSDVQDAKFATETQKKIDTFAESYNFPDGISFLPAGENQENAALLQAIGISFLIAVILIFTILVLQFDSFIQPFIILYSVILALLGVNIGLFVTGNAYSMPFMIGFIALTGIVVNDAIILIDRINRNISRGVEVFASIKEAASARLQPIILTTLTTVFGVLPLAFEDEFWAALSFTIVFGLFFGSAMTLISIPSLYYIFFYTIIGKRITAGVIDGIICLILGGILGGIFSSVVLGIFIVSLIYFVGFWGIRGQTLGYKMANISLTYRGRGKWLPWKIAVYRYFLRGILFFPSILLLLRKKKQNELWYDKILKISSVSEEQWEEKRVLV